MSECVHCGITDNFFATRVDISKFGFTLASRSTDRINGETHMKDFKHRAYTSKPFKAEQPDDRSLDYVLFAIVMSAVGFITAYAIFGG